MYFIIQAMDMSSRVRFQAICVTCTRDMSGYTYDIRGLQGSVLLSDGNATVTLTALIVVIHSSIHIIVDHSQRTPESVSLSP